MEFLKHSARIVVGLVFIFSGFVKGIDPWGSAYKFSDYFIAMNLEWLVWSAFPLGILLAFTEFAIGIGLLFHAFYRFASWMALVFMIFFTGLTLWIAIENPVTDCGCFGDALVLTNWQTFYKNLVLILLTLIVFYYRNRIFPVPGRKAGAILFGASVLIYAGFVIYSYNHLPVFDFRPYRVGVHIPEAMAVPAEAPRDEYENILYYKNRKTGEVKEFSQENYPWQDTINWQFHDAESILISKGYEPPIHDFTIETIEGENIIDFFLYDERFVFMVVAYDLNRFNTSRLEPINALAGWAAEQGMSFIGLTSTHLEDAEIFARDHGIPFDFFSCDEITLKTIIRSNPGLVVLKDGTVMAKYHVNDIPSPEEFKEKFMN